MSDNETETGDFEDQVIINKEEEEIKEESDADADADAEEREVVVEEDMVDEDEEDEEYVEEVNVPDYDEVQDEKTKISSMNNIILGPSVVKNGSIGEDMNLSDSDSDSDSESESEDEYFVSKVDYEKKMEYIKETHPQEISKTYDEMVSLTKIIRNRNKTDGEDLIVDEKHRTVPILTKYEKARVLGIRISQLNEGAPRYINFDGNAIIDNNIIAEKELRMKKLPFIITRPLPNGDKEHWRLKDLEIL